MLRAFDTVEEFWSWNEVMQAEMRANPGSLSDFRSDFARYIGVSDESIKLMPSGHQSLEWLLRSRKDPRRVVMAPAFNCKVIQDAIEAAGCRVRLYDFSPQPGLFDWQMVADQMDNSVSALIVTHYFGVPVDFRPILEICSSRGIAVIEDCAHTLGGTIDGRQVGTLGDAAIFSFNYDKPISLGWGGIAVINTADFFTEFKGSSLHIPTMDDEIKLLKFFIKAMETRRKFIPYQNSLILKLLQKLRLLKISPFKKKFEISIGAIQAELGRWSLVNYDAVLSKRSHNAEKLASNIKQSTWPVGAQINPAWLKQKVKIDDQPTLRRISGRFQQRGIRAGNFNWPELLNDNSGHNSYSNAFETATQWIDLPIHQNIDDLKIDEIIRIFQS